MSILNHRCPTCAGKNFRPHTTYTVQNGEQGQIYYCFDCEGYFSQTKNTPMENLRTPLSLIQLVLSALNNGMGVNATCETFQISKNSLYLWQKRLAGLKKVLQLYALCHQFIQQMIEGDELYTKVEKNKPAADSEGWTIVLMDRASRFLWELSCGKKERTLFEQAIQTLTQVVEQTTDLVLLTDGERRYGNLLFEICHEVVRTGRPGRPKNTLPKGVKVRVKNKGSQAHKRGPKRPKYQAPHNEHPETEQNLANNDSHANHLEAFNSALRRKLACYRRHTNTYAKKQPALQQRLDAHWVLHNFVRKHFTTKKVPAVALGVLFVGFSWHQLFSVQCFPFN